MVGVIGAFLLSLLVSSPCYGWMGTETFVATHNATGAVSHCPSWDSSYLMAWDGSDPSGQNYACFAGTQRAGTNNNGTFAGSGADTTWGSNADDDNLTWVITPSDIDIDNANGITICMEVQVDSVTNGNSLYELNVDPASGDNYSAIYLIASTGVVRFRRVGNTTIDAADTAAGVTADGTTWNTVGGSCDVAANNPDMVATTNGTWAAGDEDDDDPVAFSDDEASISIGNTTRTTGTADGFRVRKFAVLEGFETACPW